MQRRATITKEEWANFLELLKFKINCHQAALGREDSGHAIKLYYEVMAMLDTVHMLGIITDSERENIESELYKEL